MYFRTDKVTLVNLKGANSSRKSTKMSYIVKYLIERADKVDYLEHGILIEVKGLKYFYIGKLTPKGVYVSLDCSKLQKIEVRLEYMKTVIENHDVKVILCEGYFNNLSKRMHRLSFIKEFKIDRYEYYYFYSDTVEEQEKLMSKRSVKCTSYNTVANTLKGFSEELAFFKEIQDPDCISERVDIEEPRDFFVKKFFNENRDYETKEPELDF